jgi:glycosyltransferase involved in cell wall biosynthesis
MNPTFTVVIPLYNKKPYIRRCVESVLLQSHVDFELIVVDDGSTDGGLTELISLSDPRLHIIIQSNFGVGEARNTGIKQAKGVYIAFLDADDMWLPTHLQELKYIIDRYPDASLISTNHIECDTNNLNIEIADTSTRIEIIDYFNKAAKNIGIVWSSSAAIKSSVARIIGGFTRARAGEDLEYWARVALDYSVAISNKTTAIYFRGTNGIMESIERVQPSTDRTISNQLMQLRDISPSVQMICDRAELNPNLFNNPSIRNYLNSRLLGGIPGLIYRGETNVARASIKLSLRPLNALHRFYYLTLTLPDWLLSIPVFVVRTFKRVQHKSNL